MPSKNDSQVAARLSRREIETIKADGVKFNLGGLLWVNRSFLDSFLTSFVNKYQYQADLWGIARLGVNFTTLLKNWSREASI